MTARRERRKRKAAQPPAAGYQGRVRGGAAGKQEARMTREQQIEKARQAVKDHDEWISEAAPSGYEAEIAVAVVDALLPQVTTDEVELRAQVAAALDRYSNDQHPEDLESPKAWEKRCRAAEEQRDQEQDRRVLLEAERDRLRAQLKEQAAEVDRLRAQVADAWDEGWHEAGEQWLIGFSAAAEGRDLGSQGDGPPNPYRAALASGDGPPADSPASRELNAVEVEEMAWQNHRPLG